MNPLEEYRARVERWRATQTLLQRRFVLLGNWRLALGGVALVLAFLAFGLHFVTAWLLLLPIGVFVALVVWHARVTRERTLADRAVQYYERGLARLEDRWAGTDNPGERFRDPSHVYAEDLDIFGKGSLFELVSRVRTAGGEELLANWFLAPATREQASARQEAVIELRQRLELREDMALLGEDVRAETNPEVLARWGCGRPVVFASGSRILALALALAALTTLAVYLADVIPLWPFLAILAANFVFMAVVRKRVKRVLEGVEAPGHDLALLALLLQRLEQEKFQSARLKCLRGHLDIVGVRASKRIARLNRWMELLDSGDHVLLRVVRPLLLWHEQVSMAIEAWRRVTGPHIARWLGAVAEFEALSSLASLAFERPQWVFPILSEDSEKPRFEAQALQHPLMPPARCVPNDLRLDGDVRLLIVSGSNMSGKSTLLRSVGLNTVLAWAGAPVAAEQLHISPLRLGASIRVVDSLQDNRSRFFAEITRIRQIADLTKTACLVLFLLDELLSGTNSHDRRIGASGIVRELVRAGAIGMITTHDLALANIEQDLGAHALNVHFDDQMVDGRMEFDYRLRPGVVARSNALALMRAVGLQV
jgi:hypothetical protein